MAGRTLLEMTQDILSEMSSDEVSSIGDTAESLQVASIIKNKFRDIVSRSGIEEHEQPFQLDSATDSTKPVLMTIPSEVSRVDLIQYLDTTDASNSQYTLVTILPNDEFLNYVNAFSSADSDTFSFVYTNDSNTNSYTFNFKYKNNMNPRYCTIISNRDVIFDSYDVSEDDNLQSSKTLCLGQALPIFSMTDSFIPNLNEKEFALLYNESKALAFFNLKQMPNAKAEQEVRRQWSSVQKNKEEKTMPTYFNRLPDFGRRGTMNIRTRWWDSVRD